MLFNSYAFIFVYLPAVLLAFHLGRLVEVGATDKIFTNPSHKLTEDYVTGRFG